MTKSTIDAVQILRETKRWTEFETKLGKQFAHANRPHTAFRTQLDGGMVLSLVHVPEQVIGTGTQPAGALIVPCRAFIIRKLLKTKKISPRKKIKPEHSEQSFNDFLRFEIH